MYAERSLLTLLAASGKPWLVPFWQRVLDLTRKRDRSAKERYGLALAGLALPASAGDRGALAALIGAFHHSDPDVRGRAVEQMIDWPDESEHPIPEEGVAEVVRMANEDPAFGPRFLARGALFALGVEVPRDIPDGVFAFRVVFGEFSFTVELRSQDSLYDLHEAIQRALRWDDPHLFAFYMNCERADPRFALPPDDLLLNPDLNHPQEESASKCILGTLGLVPGHKFLYLFDFGDDHEFQIEVVSMRDKATPKTRYPRILDISGSRPKQYESWD